MDKTRVTIAAYIREQMKQAKHSENSLAEATGIPRVTLRRRLADPEDLTLSEVTRIALAVGVKPSSIWDRFAESAIAA